jgi:CubicO group peptidase (beta-lactamase class C family)
MKYAILAILLLITTRCDTILLGSEDQIISLQENLKSPPALNDGWEVSSLTDQNINAVTIQRLIQDLQKEPHNIHSLLIFRNNRLVSESYFDGWHRERLHASRSASKSFISTLVGIAIDKRKISSVNQKVFDFFPEYADLNNAQKNQLEIKHLLTMTAGLKWDEKTHPDDGPLNDEYAIELSNDRIRYLLEKELVYMPGNTFVYNSGLPVLESAIIERATGEDPETFAKDFFFTPLSITNYYWRRHADGLITAVGPILLRPRDMAKLGQVFLDSGKWKGQQIVSPDWVINATSTFIGSEENETGYGYHWWTAKYTINDNPVRIFSAIGSGGQYIFVAPAFNAVIVFTSGNYPPFSQGAPVGLMINKILPAFL